MNEPIPVVVKSHDLASNAPSGAVPIRLFNGVSAASFGSFYDTATQPLAANTNHLILFRNTYESEGVSVVDNSKITFAYSGVYDIQFSLQVASATNQIRNLRIWGRLNGDDLAFSTGRISISEHNSTVVPTWNYHVTVQAGDFFQLVCRSDGDQVSLLLDSGTDNYPAAASAILTVQQVNL